jgi:hypothetical protein
MITTGNSNPLDLCIVIMRPHYFLQVMGCWISLHFIPKIQKCIPAWFLTSRSRTISGSWRSALRFGDKILWLTSTAVDFFGCFERKKYHKLIAISQNRLLFVPFLLQWNHEQAIDPEYFQRYNAERALLLNQHCFFSILKDE